MANPTNTPRTSLGRAILSNAVAHADAHGPAVHHPKLQHHFETMQQQKEASTLGMWVFLLTELLFFGGLFFAYLLYRTWYFEAFAEASRTIDITPGLINTVVLILSSLTMALGVRAAQTNERSATVRWLVLTIVLGFVFLGIKVYEYADKFEHHHVPGANFIAEGPWAAQQQIFFSLYFTMTGLHALHMIIGVVMMSIITWMAHKGKFDSTYYTPVEMAGLYWHFVDLVWIYLFPLLYLVERHN
jgi:cytochrome c oxidase subunit III